jgi:hypothetical protein
MWEALLNRRLLFMCAVQAAPISKKDIVYNGFMSEVITYGFGALYSGIDEKYKTLVR